MLNLIRKSVSSLIILGVCCAPVVAAAQRDDHHDDHNRRDDRRDDHHGDSHDAYHQQYVRHNEWRRGSRLRAEDWRRGQRVDYRQYRLSAPPRGYEWREVDGNYVLAAVATGLIASIIAASAGR